MPYGIGSLAVVESLGITSGNLVMTDIAFPQPFMLLSHSCAGRDQLHALSGLVKVVAAKH